MKRNFIIILLIGILIGLTACRDKSSLNTAVEDKKELSLIELSKTLALQMSKGELKETIDALSLSTSEQLTEEDIKKVWDQILPNLGDFIDIGDTSEETIENHKVVNVILNYQNSGVRVSFTYNKDKEIEGLWIKYEPYKVEIISNDKFEEFEISFGDHKQPVEGILTLPKNIHNPPVAILVPGSGNHNADETIGINRPFRDLAYGLASHGVAVIRYHESVSQYDKPEFTIQDDCLNDASMAIKYAQNCGKVDTDGIYVIGHSLGAMMAAKIAADNEEVDGIVSLAGSPRRLEDIIVDQNEILLKATETVTEEMYKVQMNQINMQVEKIKGLKESSGEIILGYPDSFWYSLNQIDVADIVKNLNIPIFIAQGSKDFQIYADIDYLAWQDLLKDRDNVVFRLYDNLNHLFMTSNGKMDLSEYNIKGTVDQQVIDDIANWILEK
ncbi:DUF3887 domain-containing protein [Herbinix luporum]|uniref:alpha/beta hydrolase n=1 Tax=Herbinix luporum TaxID=1679721 RepID=UPI001775D4CC|nr:DUF3887 domain-containing protein [Herbinix luporum]HHT56972.1 DUF3887 domain-containing protein [Herbinix luporum]